MAVTWLLSSFFVTTSLTQSQYVLWVCVVLRQITKWFCSKGKESIRPIFQLFANVLMCSKELYLKTFRQIEKFKAFFHFTNKIKVVYNLVLADYICVQVIRFPILTSAQLVLTFCCCPMRCICIRGKLDKKKELPSLMNHHISMCWGGEQACCILTVYALRVCILSLQVASCKCWWQLRRW